MKDLFHPEYETYTKEANKIAEDFSELVKPFIQDLCNNYKTYEVENILQNEISVVMGWIRLDRQNKKWRESREALKTFVETHMDTLVTISNREGTITFRSCIESHDFIDAIKVVRSLTKCGLKDAKEFVDGYFGKKLEKEIVNEKRS